MFYQISKDNQKRKLETADSSYCAAIYMNKNSNLLRHCLPLHQYQPPPVDLNSSNATFI